VLQTSNPLRSPRQHETPAQGSQLCVKEFVGLGEDMLTHSHFAKVV